MLEMAPRLTSFRSVFRSASRPLQATYQRPFVTFSMETPIDEETLPHYNPEQFHPVHISDILNDWYCTTDKLAIPGSSVSVCQG